MPAGEEVGSIGGLGFRRDSTPIIIQITDTNAHAGGLTTTMPVSATRAVALQQLKALGARVLGIMAWVRVGEDDLTDMVIDTGGLVAPTAWGTGADRPANCPVGKCCVVAEYSTTQPAPIFGMCPLVFQADRYSENLSAMVVQGVLAVARGAKFEIATELRDDATDDVDASMFVDHVEAVVSGACSSATVGDLDADGVPDAFTAVVGGAAVCFRIVARDNTTVAAPESGARRYRATLQLTGDGVGSFASHEVWFVVPSEACAPPVLL